MPGYHKKYQKGKNNPMFFQTLPSQTPKQVKEEKIRKKIDEVYGKGFVAPYDDDAPPPKGMRLVKENLTGRQMNIAKQAAPKDKITGADFTALQEKKKKLQEMLMGRGKANAKVYQGGTGSMEAAVEEVKKQNPEATEEEIVNFLLNPEAGFQEGQKGKYGSIRMYEPLPTYEDFFRKEKGYFPSGIGEIPRAGDTPYFRMSDLEGTSGSMYYTDLEDAGDTSRLFRGTVDHGGGPGYGGAHKRYESVDDLRTVDPNDPTYHGSRYTDRRKGAKELRSAVTTAADVDEMNKKYAEFMKSVELQPQRQGKQYQILDQEVNEQGVPIRSQSFRVTGPQSQMQKTMGEKLMRAGMYIR